MPEISTPGASEVIRSTFLPLQSGKEEAFKIKDETARHSEDKAVKRGGAHGQLKQTWLSAAAQAQFKLAAYSTREKQVRLQGQQSLLAAQGQGAHCVPGDSASERQTHSPKASDMPERLLPPPTSRLSPLRAGSYTHTDSQRVATPSSAYQRSRRRFRAEITGKVVCEHQEKKMGQGQRKMGMSVGGS